MFKAMETSMDQIQCGFYDAVTIYKAILYHFTFAVDMPSTRLLTSATAFFNFLYKHRLLILGGIAVIDFRRLSEKSIV